MSVPAYRPAAPSCPMIPDRLEGRRLFALPGVATVPACAFGNAGASPAVHAGLHREPAGAARAMTPHAFLVEALLAAARAGATIDGVSSADATATPSGAGVLVRSGRPSRTAADAVARSGAETAADGFAGAVVTVPSAVIAGPAVGRSGPLDVGVLARPVLPFGPVADAAVPPRGGLADLLNAADDQASVPAVRPSAARVRTSGVGQTEAESVFDAAVVSAVAVQQAVFVPDAAGGPNGRPR